MKGKEKSRMMFWTGSIAAALLAAAAIFTVMLQMEKKVLTQYEKGVIYAAAREIPKGQLITKENEQEYLEQIELDKSCIPETAITREEQIEKLIAAGRIEKGVLLTQGMFVEQNAITEEMEEAVIAGFKAEDLYQVAGGVLRAGDRIHIYCADEEQKVSLKWENVYVQQVFDLAGRAVENQDDVTSVQRINIYLDKKDVETFYTELLNGGLRVVKVCD